jgi:ArsR family transcriptional regulator, lead/cadmium/zinc/bismuth-responsive transcriptional repressor
VCITFELPTWSAISPIVRRRAVISTCISVQTCDNAGVNAAAHLHPVDATGVERAQATVISTTEAERLGSLLGVLADPVRVRILFALASVEELCVGDLGLALDITMDQSSYALKQLRAAGVVGSRRAGRVIYYRLAEGFPHQLLEHCLHELLKIATRRESDDTLD